jgi:hypothetical protein
MRVDSISHASSVSSPVSTASNTAMPFYQTTTQMVRSQFNPASSRVLELKLMHHFTASTSQTFSDTMEQKMAWQINIPILAYDAQYLMDAILAVSALHLRFIHPDDKSLIRASHGYMASALAQYSSSLNTGLSEFNAEALFSTAALIAFQASASRVFEDDQGDGTYSLPLAWFHSFQGIKTVVMASWQWLRASDRIYPIINCQQALSLDIDSNMQLFFAPLLEGMDEQLDSLPAKVRAETRQAYEHAVAFLNWSHQLPVRNRILAFPATVSRRFVELVGLRDPRALVIISCFFAFTKAVDDVWWLQGVAKREVNGIYSLLPFEWRPKMEWATRIANLKGPIDDETWGSELQDLDVNNMKIEEDATDRIYAHIDKLAEIMNAQVRPLPPD